MWRSPYTSKYSAVVLSYFLAVAFGTALHSSLSLQNPVHGIPTAGDEKERDETGGALLRQVRSSGTAWPNAQHVDAGNPVSSPLNSLQFEQQQQHVKFPHQIPLLRFRRHLDKQKNKGGNSHHPQPDEPGAKVHCWNEAHVFDVVLPASEVAKHFPHEWQLPWSCNTTCVARIPCRNLCAGLRSGCTEPGLHTVPERQEGAAQCETKQLASFEKNVERHLSELDAKLVQLLSESSYLKDNLVSLGYNLILLIEALKENLSAASVKILDSLDRKAAEMKSFLNEKGESMMTAISSVLSLIQSDTKTHMWTLKGYAAKKAEAIKSSFSWRVSEKVYIKRYLMSWGICFTNSTGNVSLRLCLQLHKGISDDFLEWPFSNKLKLSIIHPDSGEKQETLGVSPEGELINTDWSRPVQGSDTWVYVYGNMCESSYLERNGYVKNDQLLLKLEVFSDGISRAPVPSQTILREPFVKSKAE